MIFYRGLSLTDAEAETIRKEGVIDKYYKYTTVPFFKDKNILVKSDEEIKKIAVEVDDLVYKKDSRLKSTFVVACERDAAFYALNPRWGHEFSDDKNTYIIELNVPKTKIVADPMDFLYPLSYIIVKWTYDYEQVLCRLLGEDVVEEYKEIFKRKIYATVNGDIMSNDKRVIDRLYNNKEILLCGKREVKVFSSFIIKGDIKANNINRVEKLSKKDCEDLYKNSIRPKIGIGVHSDIMYY